MRTPHVEAAYHLQLQPGTNVAVMNAVAHVVVTEGLTDTSFVADALRHRRLRHLGGVCRPAGEQPGGDRGDHRRAGGRSAGGGPPVRHGP